jgi:Effector Associated Constant Component 1
MFMDVDSISLGRDFRSIDKSRAAAKNESGIPRNRNRSLDQQIGNPFCIAEGQPVERDSYEITVEAQDRATAGRGAQALADALREADGVLEADRRKAEDTTMDLGVIVSVIATSGATLAIAQGVAAWLRARKGAKIRIERDGKSGSIKAAVEGIDAEAAVRIAEIVRGMT